MVINIGFHFRCTQSAILPAGASLKIVRGWISVLIGTTFQSCCEGPESLAY